ncbi:MAG: hypothetical protein FJW83_06510 [Actinobacteria bacterium]|nr:hypothetical protein [Actinomycetota bacterium]
MRRLLVLMAAFIVVAACGAPANDDRATATTATALDTTTSAAASTSSTAPLREVLPPTKGPGTAPAGAGAGGPWSTGMSVAFADELGRFTRSEWVTDQAGVPNLITDRNGRLLAYHIDWAAQNGIAVAIREPGPTTKDSTWIRYRVRIDGLPTGKPDPVDPSAVLLDDGRIRLYWMRVVNGRAAIQSAMSNDGVTFKLEPGDRFSTGTELFDPTVVRHGGRWLLVTGPDGAHHAYADDGLTFGPDLGPFLVEGTATMVWAAYAAGDTTTLLTAAPGRPPLTVHRSVAGGAFTRTFVLSVDGSSPAPDAGLVPFNGGFALAYLRPLG